MEFRLRNAVRVPPQASRHHWGLTPTASPRAQPLSTRRQGRFHTERCERDRPQEPRQPARGAFRSHESPSFHAALDIAWASSTVELPHAPPPPPPTPVTAFLPGLGVGHTKCSTRPQL